MRLKSIKLAGFKSFAEPTRLEFPSQITCIVGPNGCGKSNTLDAIRWVMGESAAKALRGGEMNDVLFNGTQQRKPVSQCSVELLFDNSDHRLKGAWNRYSELSVRRVHHREQGTQYYLNAQRCRRRDIMALFDGTGLGPRSYALIGQGNISRIIESRPEQLRLFLEEAAGVGYYRQRRKETLARLETAEENLAQLQVQYATWQTQAEQLKQQCEAAAQYKALSEEIEQLSRWRYQLRYQALRDKLEKLNRQHQQMQQAHSQQVLKVERLQKEMLLQEKRLPDLRREVGRLQRDVHQLDKTLALKQAEYDRHHAEVARLKADIDAQRQQLKMLETQRAQLDAQYDRQALAQLPQLIQQRQQAQQALGELETQLHQAQTQSHQSQQVLHTLQQQLLSAERERDQAAQRLEQAQFKVEQLTQQIEMLEHQRAALDLSGLEKQLEQQQAAQADALRRLEHIQQTLTEQTRQLEAADQARDAAQTQVQTLKSEITALSAELQGLKQAQAQLLHNDSERGNLVRQIRVSAPEWQTAVEAWLGSWLQGQVVRQWPEVIPDQLPFVGVETDLPQRCTPPDPDWCSLLDVLEAPNCILQAASLIWCSEKTPSSGQLAQLPPEQGVLTPDGCLWHPYGVERLHTELTGILARQARIEMLEQQLHDHRQQLRHWQAQLDEAQVRLNQRQSEQAALKAQQQQVQDQLRRLTLELEHLQQQLAQKQREQTQLQQQRETLAQALTAQQQQAHQAQQALETHQQQVETLHQQLDTLTHQYQAQQQALAEIEEQVNGQRQQVDRLSAQIDRLQQVATAYEQQQAALQTRQTQLQATLATQEKHFSQLQSETLDKAVLDELQTQLHTRKQQLRDLRDQLQQQERQLDQLRHQYQMAEKAAYEQQTRLTALQLEVEQTQTALHNWTTEAESAGLRYDHLRQQPLDAPDLKTVENRLRQAQRARDNLGAVNMTAIEAWAQLQTQMSDLEAQMNDIHSAVETLQQSIRKIDRDSRRRLRETFEQVNEHFMRLFPVIFRGGKARLQWQEPEVDPLDNGVVVMAQPPGKRNTRIQMLSGGEKTLTALALIFSLFELNPAPFCVLDEVDAPLDDANVMRFCELVKSMAERVQFIIITHNKTTMTMADQLLGVTMHEPGVSRVVSVDLNTAVDMIEEPA